MTSKLGQQLQSKSREDTEEQTLSGTYEPSENDDPDLIELIKSIVQENRMCIEDTVDEEILTKLINKTRESKSCSISGRHHSH